MLLVEPLVEPAAEPPAGLAVEVDADFLQRSHQKPLFIVATYFRASI
jgi:hypothetical protein